MNPNDRSYLARLNPANAEEQRIAASLSKARDELAKAEHAFAKMVERKSFPEVPDARLGDRFTMNIRFHGNHKVYEFLLLRNNGIWYTTGTTAESKKFPSWQCLVKWVRSETADDVRLRPLGLMQKGNNPFAEDECSIKISK